MGNMDIYEAGRNVPQEAQKAFNNGKFSGTDINPMWRIKKLTELFGPCGIGWYVGDVVERSEVHGNVTMAIVDLNLYVKVNGEWSKPIYGTGGNVLLRKDSPSDEGYKMAYTDALSVACKALGIGADIYFSTDKTKYTAPKEAPAHETKPSEDLKMRCECCGAVLKPYIGADGKEVSIRKHAEGSKAKFNGVFCLDCIKSGRIS